MFAKCYQLASFYYLVSKKGRFFRPDLATNWLTMKIVLCFLTIAREILLITLFKGLALK